MKDCCDWAWFLLQGPKSFDLGGADQDQLWPSFLPLIRIWWLVQINELLGGSSGRTPTYDYAEHTRKVSKHLIVRTTGYLHRGRDRFLKTSAFNLMDIKIFADTDDDVRIIRWIKRDMEGAWLRVLIASLSNIWCGVPCTTSSSSQPLRYADDSWGRTTIQDWLDHNQDWKIPNAVRENKMGRKRERSPTNNSWNYGMPYSWWDSSFAPKARKSSQSMLWWYEKCLTFCTSFS